MTIEEFQSIKEFARNLGYIVKDYTNYDKFQKNNFEDWQFIICVPGFDDYKCVVDYTYDDSTMFELMECVNVFFEEDASLIDDMITWYSHTEMVNDYPLNKLKSVLIRVMKNYKQKKIDLKKEELEKDFEK